MTRAARFSRRGGIDVILTALNQGSYRDVPYRKDGFHGEDILQQSGKGKRCAKNRRDRPSGPARMLKQRSLDQLVAAAGGFKDEARIVQSRNKAAAIALRRRGVAVLQADDLRAGGPEALADRPFDQQLR